MDSIGSDHYRKYNIENCITFRKTNEKYGGLSNMAPGYPIIINRIHFLTSEALYQCCRFPHQPNIQKEIIQQRSPMIAKQISRSNTHLTRPDWNQERINIMRWCLYVKLICNWGNFGRLLDSTENYYIVEDSYKDDFWGAVRHGDHYVGVNALGRLLMQVREKYRNIQRGTLVSLPPPNIPHFIIMEKRVDNLFIQLN